MGRAIHSQMQHSSCYVGSFWWDVYKGRATPQLKDLAMSFPSKKSFPIPTYQLVTKSHRIWAQQQRHTLCIMMQFEDCRCEIHVTLRVRRKARDYEISFDMWYVPWDEQARHRPLLRCEAQQPRHRRYLASRDRTKE